MKKEEVLKHINPLFLKGICHRGLHNKVDTENGLRAFKNALNLHFAIEFDVHLSKDKQIVVIHDSSLKRVTGKEGIVEELTLEELKNNYSLLDGEKIPTLKEVFSLINEEIPMVIELKVYKGNYKELAKYLTEELKSIQDKRNVLLISFDPRALLPFKNSGFMRQLLVDIAPKHVWTYSLRHLFEGVDLHKDLLKRKHFQSYVKKHFVNCWTIESIEDFKEIYPYVDTVTLQLTDQDFIREELNKK